jgi:uncharacterized protein (TIGR03083 family)
MDTGAHIATLQRAAGELHRAAGYAGPNAPVPSCPGWTVNRLLRHITRVHAWAVGVLRGADPKNVEFVQPPDDELESAYVRGVGRLVEALTSTPRTRQVWTMYPFATPVGFWARRQAHETLIHRVDAQLAAGTGVMEIETEVAEDGLAELLMDLAPERFVAQPSMVTATVTFTPLDCNRAWTVTAGRQGLTTVEEARDRSDLTIFGTSSDLYRWAWNRARDDEVALRGDLRLADLWRRAVRVGSRRD